MTSSGLKVRFSSCGKMPTKFIGLKLELLTQQSIERECREHDRVGINILSAMVR